MAQIDSPTDHPPRSARSIASSISSTQAEPPKTSSSSVISELQAGQAITHPGHVSGGEMCPVPLPPKSGKPIRVLSMSSGSMNSRILNPIQAHKFVIPNMRGLPYKPSRRPTVGVPNSGKSEDLIKRI